MAEVKFWMGDEAKTTPIPRNQFDKAEPLDRLWAQLIDYGVTLVGLVLCCIPGLAYTLVKDALYDGRSIGKKVMGLRVLNAETLTPCKTMESVTRNIALLIPFFNLYEAYLVFTDPQGLRSGDNWAKTEVVKAKQ